MEQAVGAPYVPPGAEFYDVATGRMMKIITEGPYEGWLARKHRWTEDWVTVREATADDRQRIAAAASGWREPGGPSGL